MLPLLRVLVVACALSLGLVWLSWPQIAERLPAFGPLYHATSHTQADPADKATSSIPNQPTGIPTGSHPIDRLIAKAEQQFQTLIKEEPHSLQDATRAYRRKRGRYPPPGFDAWFKFAQANDAMVPESFFDQIYEDLEPFWGIDPNRLREFAASWPDTISIRNSVASIRDKASRIPMYNLWIFTWAEMIAHMGPLPDVDLALWQGDEPRVVLTFEQISKHMGAAEEERREQVSMPLESVHEVSPTYPDIDGKMPKGEPQAGFTSFGDREYWDFVMQACKPDDPVFTEPERQLFGSFPPTFSNNFTTGTHLGFVSNFTIAKNVCHNPNLRSLHGFMIAPHLSGVYTELVPVFSVAKLAGVSNDILVPTPEHWNDAGLYAGLETTMPWTDKVDRAVWRGTASGGQHNESNWPGFQRHRMMAMMNSSTVARVEQEMSTLAQPSYEALEAASPQTFDWGMHNIPWSNPELFDIAASKDGNFSNWIARSSDGGFTQFYCSPDRLMAQNPRECYYTDPYYHAVNKLNTSQVLSFKYLPDIDGQSTSGRFRGFLRSLSVPIKATIFNDWFDARLVPWRHFVPMSNEFQEWWALLDYFIGYTGSENESESIGREGHDAVAEEIGRLGSDWAHHITRKENMLLYFYRLILEYARICADNRVELGYIDDLLEEGHQGDTSSLFV